jgi:uncharacterized protein
MTSPQAALLPDGRRLHLQHGPIDLVIEAFGARDEVGEAYRQARDRFETILSELVVDLAALRRPLMSGWQPDSAVAARMLDAVRPHDGVFVTPMAAVAGAVADEVMTAMVDSRAISKAYINNSGDIAVYLTRGETLRLGIISELFNPTTDGTAELAFDQPVRGIATSGWQGRSFSFGIADAVTVLAPSAAAADVAATLIANAVNADHPAIERVAASSLDDDTDLGDRLVTVEVGDIDREAVETALNSGEQCAATMVRAGHIVSAALFLCDAKRIVGDLSPATVFFE